MYSDCLHRVNKTKLFWFKQIIMIIKLTVNPITHFSSSFALKRKQQYMYNTQSPRWLLWIVQRIFVDKCLMYGAQYKLLLLLLFLNSLKYVYYECCWRVEIILIEYTNKVPITPIFDFSKSLIAWGLNYHVPFIQSVSKVEWRLST